MFIDYTSNCEVRVEPSESETSRFGLSVGRLLVPLGCGLSDQELAQMCASSPAELIIVRASTSRIDLGNALRSVEGRQVIHADVLEYFSWDLLKHRVFNIKSGRFDISQTSNYPKIEKLVREAFVDYRNHYSANPRLSRSSTVEGYLEWAKKLMESDNCRTYIATEPSIGSAAGFVLTHLFSKDQTAEVLLNAVASEFRRMGVFSDCMVGAAKTMQEFDHVNRIVISTQSTNTAALTSWRSLGLEPWFSINTFHVMREGM